VSARPQSRRPPPRTPRDELAEATAHGALYLRRLRRAQLALSLLALTAFAGLVGALPLVLYLEPRLLSVDVLGVPLTLALLAVPPFPFFVAVAWLYARRAAELERAFGELVGDP
jgi:hypothetical protein